MHLYCIYVSSRLDLSCLPLLHSTVLRGPIKTKNVWKTGRSPWFLGSMLPQYMSLSVCFVLFVLFVCLFRQKFFLSKRPSSYCLIHFRGSSGAAQGQLGGGRRPLMEDDLRWKTTFEGRWPFMEDDLQWNV